jgi:1-acyl-sn-glycerol-3-phosphate acyltransferase
LLKIISYPISVLFYLCFACALVVFHLGQLVGFSFFGYKGHKKVVDALNWSLLKVLHILGTRFSFTIEEKIPENVPLIIVSNHQTTWDIPSIIWHLRKLHPAFIAKKELGKGIPSISYNLTRGASILIDRKNPLQATQQIIDLGQYAAKNNRSVVIFPEGTRSKDGTPKAFKARGLKTLFEQMPGGYVVPVTVNNSWKLQKHGFFPMGLGVHLKHHVHPAIKISDHTPQELVIDTEQIITKNIITK